MSAHVLAFDVGTTGMKTCLFEIGSEVSLVASSMQGYGLTILDNGGAEQDPEEWWRAMCVTTERVLGTSGVRPEAVDGLSFCSQMQGLVLVDACGNPVRKAMSYMDRRAGKELREGIAHGLTIAGVNARKLVRSLMLTGAVAASVKDPVWKYKWVEANEPGVFAKTFRWLDVKEFLIAKCTGAFVMSRDSAFATLLYDTRKGREGWSGELCRMFGVKEDHLPEIIRSTDSAGGLTPGAARELGLPQGTPVFAGGGDASLIGVGAGAVDIGNTHIYSGTSGWVSTVVDRQVVDVQSMIASIAGAGDGTWNYFAELETAGKCLEWVKDHLALDEIGVYLEKRNVSESKESEYRSLYDYLTEVVDGVPAGSGGVVFTPWLHGNRCPFEDPAARGMFFNISLETGKSELIRSVLEGVCFHLRWQLEAQERKVKTSPVIRFVGGGALSPVTCRMLADILDRNVETVPNPQNSGAVGAALVAAVGMGLVSGIGEVKNLVAVSSRYSPDERNREVYDKNYGVFKTLYRNNRTGFRLLNGR